LSPEHLNFVCTTRDTKTQNFFATVLESRRGDSYEVLLNTRRGFEEKSFRAVEVDSAKGRCDQNHSSTS